MKRHISVIIVLVLLLLPTTIFAEAENVNPLFMEKAILYLEKHNNTLLSMDESVEIARKQYNSAVTNTKNLDTKGFLLEIYDQEIYIHFDTNTKMLLTLQKELYPEQMKFSWDMAKDSRRLTLNSMVIGLRGLYLGVYNASEDCSLKQRSYDLAQTIYNQGMIRYEKGMITEIDYAQYKFDLLKAKAAYDASRRNYENIMRTFNSFIGIELETTYSEIVYEEEYDPNALQNYDFYVERALSSRLEITSGIKQIALLEKKKAIMEDYPYSIVLPSNKKDYENMLNDIDKQSLLLEKAKIDIEKGIMEAYIEASESNSNIIGLKKVLDLQKSNLENMKGKYEAGLISKTMLDQIQIGHDEMENGYKAALFDYNTKLLKLEYAAGTGPAY